MMPDQQISALTRGSLVRTTEVGTPFTTSVTARGDRVKGVHRPTIFRK